MVALTVTGGQGHPDVMLSYSAKDLSFIQAQAFASYIDDTYQSAHYYHPGQSSLLATSGYLIVPAGDAGNVISAKGFGAVVDANNTRPSTIVGGSSAGGQIVLAAKGGLTYSAAQGSNTVVAGGGNNHISFKGSNGNNVAITSGGNDTIIGGSGLTTISDGGGNNKIVLGSGRSELSSLGNDIVKLDAGGSDTINVCGHGSDLVLGASGVTGVKLTFFGGDAASTVLGGTGQYNITGGKGGGVFHGGSDGGNLIVGGAGSVKIYGGGSGDTLEGGSGPDLIVASVGNATLVGGGGADTFSLKSHLTNGKAGVGTQDTILDFATKDVINVGGTSAVNYALNTYELTSAGGSFLLHDGTKVVLDNYVKPLTAGDFKH